LDSAIAQSEVWSPRNAQRIAETKRKKTTSLFGSSLVLIEFRTQRKTDPKIEMTRYIPLFCYISVRLLLFLMPLSAGYKQKNTIKSAGMTKGRLTTPDRALMQE